MKNFAVAVTLAAAAVLWAIASIATTPAPIDPNGDRNAPVGPAPTAGGLEAEGRATSAVMVGASVEPAAAARPGLPGKEVGDSAQIVEGKSGVDSAKFADRQPTAGPLSTRTLAGSADERWIAGRVERRDGSPEAGALVHLVPQDSLARLVSTTTDERGVFRAEVDTRDVAWEITATSGRLRANATLAPGDESTELTLRLESGRGLHGVIVQSTDDLPIRHAYVSIERRTGSQLDRLRRWRRVTESGSFSFEGVEPGTYLLSARAEGFARTQQEVVIAGAHATQRRVSMVTEQLQRGRVVDVNGQPVVGARVDVRHAGSSYELSDVTGADGNFVVSGLGVHAVDLRVHADGHATVTLPAFFASEAIAEIELVPAAEVTGIVIDAETSRPIPFATVAATPGADAPAGSLGGRARTGVDGRFHLHGLSEGVWMLLVNAAGHVGARVTIEVGVGDPEHTVALEPGRSLVGTVASEDGTPVAGARVQIASQSQQGEAVEVFSVESDSEGAFQFDGLGASDYQMVVTRSGFAQQVLPCSLGEPVAVTLARGGNIRGQVVAENGTPAGMVSARPLHGGTTVRLRVSGRGDFRVTGLAAGEYHVRFEGSAGFAESTVVVRAEEETFQALHLSAANAGA